MYKILRSTKDGYITDRVIRGERTYSANTGEAASLDLFKLYGITSSGSTPNVELSRLLIKFDLDPIRELISQNKIDPASSTFSCRLKLFNVFGGQPAPRNCTLQVNPLSRSFDEGLGRDIVLYGDHDVCNFLTASRTGGAWFASGANSGGHNGENVDYLTTFLPTSSSLTVTQTLIRASENLDVDVTTIMSATLTGQIPDEGFRISFSPELENDTRTYFVKRFAARHAHDHNFHPQLNFGFDDSVQDHVGDLRIGETQTVFLRNSRNDELMPLVSASNDVTSLKLRLITPISGGFQEYSFQGGQHTIGATPVSGLYSASVLLDDNDLVLREKLAVSGSIRFTAIWGSDDGTVGFNTGSVIVNQPARGGIAVPTALSTHINGLKPSYSRDETITARVTFFDPNSPSLFLTRVPLKNAGRIFRNAFYRVRDANTKKVLIPFDTDKGSTRLSSDSEGMYFSLDADTMTVGSSYVFDLLVRLNGQERIYENASMVFSIVDPL